MALSFTERAVSQVRNYLEEGRCGMGIRIIVQSSECSGMAYRLVFVDEQEAHDVVFCSHDAEIFVDPLSLIWLEGTVVDFVQNGDESGFVFQNPSVKNQCGCGDGFYV